MDRLPPLAAASSLLALAAGLSLLGAAGCEDEAPSTSRRRVEAVMSDAPQRDPLESFCDVRVQGPSAKALELPPLDKAPAKAGGRWLWLNVWATWCHPCIEEMPRLLEWQGRFRAKGAAVELTFLSVDETSEVVEVFRKAHPGLPASLRLAAPEALEGWITGLGLDKGATLPLHVFADPAGKVRCARSGAVGEADFESVEALIASSP